METVDKDMETWTRIYTHGLGHGEMEQGDIETERHETWRHGDVEAFRQGDIETWRHGEVETWRRRDMET
jgi:hypothetical protein